MNALIDEKLLNDPKMFALAAHMGWSEDLCVGKLTFFWIWCQHQTEIGDLSIYPPSAIARSMLCEAKDGPKIIAGMMLNPKDSFLVRNSDGLHVRNWWKFTGAYWRKKYQNYPDKWNAIKSHCEKIDQNDSSENLPPIVAPQNISTIATKPLKRVPANIPIEEFKQYGQTIGLTAEDCEHFKDHYDTNGWVQGNKGKPIVNWKTAMHGWKRNKEKFSTSGNGKSKWNQVKAPVSTEVSQFLAKKLENS